MTDADGQFGQRGLQRHPVADRVEGRVPVTEQVQPFRRVVGAGTVVQRLASVCGGAGIGGAHVRLRDAENGGDLGRGRRVLQPLCQFGAGPGDVQTAFLHLTGQVHAPHPVPEVPLELAGDRGVRVRREVAAPARVISIDGFHQRQSGHLAQVVEMLATVAVPGGEAVCEGQIASQDLLTQPFAFARRAAGPVHPPERLHRGRLPVIGDRRAHAGTVVGGDRHRTSRTVDRGRNIGGARQIRRPPGGRSSIRRRAVTFPTDVLRSG
ncbi:hypothetical protein J2S44_007770 [Catenuloplanes niger]|uniref:Uncharacterized protein n=1 Tax=Catenuloplanes niger TaxID=587534 RepID=A0AAE4CWT0_9ACTN|nr:hypothetical protein [Catenuloplanes niger]MDR7327520.1 hypothetical protein [Catenuloplanes niger]